MSTIEAINAFLASQLQDLTGAPAPALHASPPVQTQEQQLIIQLHYMLDQSRQREEQLQKIIQSLQKHIDLLQQERQPQQQLRSERCAASQGAHAPPLQEFPSIVNRPQAPVLYSPSQVSCESFFPLKSPRIFAITPIFSNPDQNKQTNKHQIPQPVASPLYPSTLGRSLSTSVPSNPGPASSSPLGVTCPPHPFSGDKAEIGLLNSSPPLHPLSNSTISRPSGPSPTWDLVGSLASHWLSRAQLLQPSIATAWELSIQIESRLPIEPREEDINGGSPRKNCSSSSRVVNDQGHCRFRRLPTFSGCSKSTVSRQYKSYLRTQQEGSQ